MKATLEFDLSPGSDDQYDWKCVQQATDMMGAITDFGNYMRSLCKYGEHSEEVDEVLESVREKFWECLSDNEVTAIY